MTTAQIQSTYTADQSTLDAMLVCYVPVLVKSNGKARSVFEAAHKVAEIFFPDMGSDQADDVAKVVCDRFDM